MFSKNIYNIKKIISLVVIMTVLLARNKKVPQFYDANKRFEGQVAVETKGIRGYIDKTGKVVINPSLTEAGDCLNGLARVRIGVGKTDKWDIQIKQGRLFFQNKRQKHSSCFRKHRIFHIKNRTERIKLFSPIFCY